MVPSPNEQISTFLSEHIAQGDFPSAVYLVGQDGEIVFTDALGQSTVDPYHIQTHLNTVYDLASLTKPLITSFLCAHLIELGEIGLDSSVSHYLGEFDRTDKRMITVRELLTHTSGLPAWKPLYILAEDEPERAAGAIASLALQYKSGTQVLYSDLGFITLGILLERLMGHPLSDLAQKEIFNPLKLEHTQFNPDLAQITTIAASETGNRYELDVIQHSAAGFYANMRKRLIWGEVHDGNAYFLGGAAGHAGLFSNAYEVFKLTQQFLGKHSKLLTPATCEMFRQNMSNELNEARSLGWQLAATPESTAGASLPPDSFGHNGFTGTSCWVDAENDRVFILLTNRTHGRALPFANINAVRRQFATLAVEALG